ncbi:histidine kinase [Myxococcota bacterium]|nr:histidine kinase [Myxococcota bacterium]
MNSPSTARTERPWGRALLEGMWKYLFIALVVTLILTGVSNEWTLEAISVRFVINLLISLAIGLTITALVRLVLVPLALDRRPLALRWAAWAVVMSVAVVAGAELALSIVGAISPRALGAYPHTAVIVVSIPVTLVAVTVSLRLEQLRARATHLEVSEAQAQRALLRAQLDALQARVNPHFLFNSLNTVAALIGEDPARAERAVERLATLYRYTLEGSRRERVTLAEELAGLEDYLALERLRFGDRLTVTVDVAPDVRTIEVPPLILQPLVENAIKHGVAARRGAGRVLVRAERSDERLVLTVEDDGPGPGASAHVGARSSHDDLRARLGLLYGGTGKLVTDRGPLGGFRVCVELPREGVPT